MMVIYIDSDKLAKAARSAQSPEVRYKSHRVSSQSNDGAIHVNHEGVGSIYLGTCG